MTPLDHNLTRVLYPILCDLAEGANKAGHLTPAKAGQMASKPTARAVEAVANELKRMIRVEEGKVK
ncbi:hypothetical protein [uncultured Brevundimonas sp.]|uniref:hypothetical protein n=1 Tax=uncultured Brevundimonas sp. TaxID=213418 RepID=UPI0026210DF6|nr:hypothetical protein [uncultured Brevundimonas sp.]